MTHKRQSSTEPPGTPTAADLARESGARSLTEVVYEQIRADIIAARLRQGEKLLLSALQARYGVSLSVVRESLARLASDGLVIADPQRGFRISAISREDLVDCMRTRIAIEGMALQLAIAKGDAAWQAKVEQAHDRLRNVSRQTDVVQWAALHQQFHELLVAPCGSPWLLRFRHTLFEQSERYRNAAIHQTTMLNQAEVDAQHRALVDAVLQRNPAKAQFAMDVHLSATLERALISLSL